MLTGEVKKIEKPRIILLGASGFLGKYLHRLFIEQGFEIETVSTNLDVIRERYSRPTERSGEAFFVSMVWSSNKSSKYQDDLQNFYWAKFHIEIAKLCLRNNYSLLVPGSCLEYSKVNQTNYVLSKIQLRCFLENNLPEHQFIWIKYFYIFSVGDERPNLIREALLALNRGVPFTSENPNNHHDFIEIRDAVDQTVEILKNHKYGIWDVGTGQIRSNVEMLSKIQNLVIGGEHKTTESNSGRVGWHGKAEKLIPNHKKFTRFTSEYFDGHYFMDTPVNKKSLY